MTDYCASDHMAGRPVETGEGRGAEGGRERGREEGRKRRLRCAQLSIILSEMDAMTYQTHHLMIRFHYCVIHHRR